MNQVRLLTFFTGLLFLIMGLIKLIFRMYREEGASYYTSVILIVIGTMLVLAVRKK